jgi:predicted enzyme related to lactoylglutathione lyase
MGDSTVDVSIGAIAFDCDDPRSLIEFYTSLFGAEPGFVSDDFAAVKVQGLWLSAHRVDDYRRPGWPDSAMPKQVHLDIAVDDVEQGVARATSLGAVIADPQPQPERWRVMLDPAGHPFCVSPRSSFP